MPFSVAMMNVFVLGIFCDNGQPWAVVGTHFIRNRDNVLAGIRECAIITASGADSFTFFDIGPAQHIVRRNRHHHRSPHLYRGTCFFTQLPQIAVGHEEDLVGIKAAK